VSGEVMSTWEYMIMELEQKAIVKFGKNKYIVMLALLSGKQEETVRNVFTAERPPYLSIYATLLEIVDMEN
jgi:hypothetical protein